MQEKIENVCNDFLHKLSSDNVRENQVIITEDLDEIPDKFWSKFYDMLEYKAKWYGRIYHKVSPWYTLSQVCDKCGFVNKKVERVSDREWKCSNCGTLHKRYMNSVKDIFYRGLVELKFIQV